MNKYEQYISKSLSAGTENKTGAAKAQQVLSNMSHNLQAFVKQVHTYFNEQTKTGDRKWVNNERVVTSLNKKFDKLENRPIDSKIAFADVQQSIKEARELLKSMNKSGIPESKINELNNKLNVLDKKILEKERENGLQIVTFEGSHVVNKTLQKDRLEGLKDRGMSDKGLEIVTFEGSRVMDKTPQKDRLEGLKGRGIKDRAEDLQMVPYKREQIRAEIKEKAEMLNLENSKSLAQTTLSAALRKLINLTNNIAITQIKGVYFLEDFKGFKGKTNPNVVIERTGMVMQFFATNPTLAEELTNNKELSEAYNDVRMRLAAYTKLL